MFPRKVASHSDHWNNLLEPVCQFKSAPVILSCYRILHSTSFLNVSVALFTLLFLTCVNITEPYTIKYICQGYINFLMILLCLNKRILSSEKQFSLARVWLQTLCLQMGWFQWWWKDKERRCREFLASATIIALLGLAFVAIGFATHNWTEVRVNRTKLKELANATKDTAYLVTLATDYNYFDRDRGLFEMCFPDTSETDCK